MSRPGCDKDEITQDGGLKADGKLFEKGLIKQTR